MGTREVERIAATVLDSFDRGVPIEPISWGAPGFDLDAAYEVLRDVAAHRVAQGWVTVGRKIGFTNRTIWELFHVEAPVWAHMWDRTVTYADEGRAIIDLGNLLEPRIEPEVVFKLREPISGSDDVGQILSKVEWMAPGFEIVQSIFPDWRFSLADATAAFGMHGQLIVGSREPVSAERVRSLLEDLRVFEATLARDGEAVDRGIGSNVLDSPAHALGCLAQVLADQPHQPPLAAGEIITTGTITNPWSIQPGETWSSTYSLLGLEPLTIQIG